MTALSLSQSCTQLPAKTVGPGTLHLRFLSPHALGKLQVFLRNAKWEHAESDCVLSISVPGRDLSPLVSLLTESLSENERLQIRALFQPRGREMGLSDYFDVDSLQAWVVKEQNTWLLDMMRAHRMQTVFQPILSCRDTSQVFAYECLLRGRDGGNIVYPTRILDVARGSGLLFQVDFAARRTAICAAARHKIPHKIFINFTPMDRDAAIHCLRSTLDIVDELKMPREQIVFEVIESELIHDVETFKNVLAFYRECGFGIALDDLGSGYASLSLLSQLRPDYVKLDRSLMRDVHRDKYKALISRKLLETARELGIATIAEGIECEGEWEWLRGQGGDYVQGFHFAAPNAVPPLLNPLAPQPDAPVPTSNFSL